MTDTRPPPPTRTSSRGHWILICVLLTPAVVGPLMVWLYDRTDPTLFGFPFYFWAQMMMIPAAVVLTVIAYYLAKEAERRDHVARREAGR
ncbi:MAG TPA: DUF3311 domain-containing protein [Nocardioidaceae bacterium]|nr:DUF3311 domain-containing protein [Nocardioidaceae bacterium]